MKSIKPTIGRCYRGKLPIFAGGKDGKGFLVIGGNPYREEVGAT
jgi:hypothetical protein